MDFKNELKQLVDFVKSKAKGRGEKLTNEEIAARLGYGRTTFSTLISGDANVSKKHIDNFRAHFRDELEGSAIDPFPVDDPLNWERAKVINHDRQIVKLMQQIADMQGKSRTAEDCFEEIDSDFELILADLRRKPRG